MNLVGRALLFCTMAVGAPALAGENMSELGGWRLQQFRELADSVLGEPFKTIEEAGHQFKAYRIGGEAYMVFGQDQVQPANIGSLQLTGTAAPELTFKGLKLGSSKSDVVAILGEPSHVIEIPDPRVTKLEYDGRNYSVEIDQDNKLYSILISTTPGFMAAPEHDDGPWDAFVQILETKDANGLIQLFRPDMEVYENGEILAIRARFSDFMASPDPRLMDAFMSDEKGVAHFVRDFKAEENMRVTENMGIGLVYKFPPESRLQEVVFFPYAGQYLIYEVAFRDPAPTISRQ